MPHIKPAQTGYPVHTLKDVASDGMKQLFSSTGGFQSKAAASSYNTDNSFIGKTGDAYSKLNFC